MFILVKKRYIYVVQAKLIQLYFHICRQTEAALRSSYHPILNEMLFLNLIAMLSK